jgi:regulator of protease activity HflC (stomatin/prohibitin superfamily)
MTYVARPRAGEEEPEPQGPTARQRLGRIGRRVLAPLGLMRPRGDDGSLGPRRWGRLSGFFAVVFALWVLSTSVHVVQAGNVGVPVTLGRAGSPLGQGMHVTWPFTVVKQMSSRTTDYTMAQQVGEGEKSGRDDSVAVLGSDGGTASVDSTVLFRIEDDRATDIYLNIGLDYVTTLIRPSARTCIRSVFTNTSLVDAATVGWHDIEDGVTECMLAKIQGRGIVLEDFQLREVRLEDSLQQAVTAKVAAQQESDRQKFELSIARQQAEITRVDALATADGQQILACGGDVIEGELPDGSTGNIVVPNDVDDCDQAQLTPQYLQWTYIQALRALVDSPNNSTIILPFDQELTPLLNVGGPATVTTAPPEE